LSWYDASSPYLAIKTGNGQMGLVTGGGVQMGGTVRCMTDDPACLSGGLDGRPFIIFIDGLQGPIDPATMNIVLERSRVTSLKIGDQDFGPMNTNAYGKLSCAGEACQTLNLQMGMCGSGGARQLGMVINGVVDAADYTVWRNNLQAPAEHSLPLKSLGGTAYLTREGSSNPVCGGRDLGAVFADEYDPLAVDDLPGRSTDVMPFDVPEAEGGRVDRKIVIDVTSAGLRDMEIILVVKGYFFGQCGVEPQARAGVGDDANPVQLLIYRVIPDDATCIGGMEPFEVEIPVKQLPGVQDDGRFPININGQWSWGESNMGSA
jgi:hypothetical protein